MVTGTILSCVLSLSGSYVASITRRAYAGARGPASLLHESSRLSCSPLKSKVCLAAGKEKHERITQ